ncbi:MAG: hypothetical protein JWO03_3327, partial [Bacteroidetes bacterium]|nr:hypothetical protein [Bacteroidota bacterium]
PYLVAIDRMDAQAYIIAGLQVVFPGLYLEWRRAIDKLYLSDISVSTIMTVVIGLVIAENNLIGGFLFDAVDLVGAVHQHTTSADLYFDLVCLLFDSTVDDNAVFQVHNILFAALRQTDERISDKKR